MLQNMTPDDRSPEEDFKEAETNIFTVVYETIRANYHEFGYAKSPDFKIKSEYIINKKLEDWLIKQEKDASLLKFDDAEFRNNLKDDDYNIKSGIKDIEEFFEHGYSFYDFIHPDRVRFFIKAFASKLFDNWMEEYERLNSQPVKGPLT